MKTLENLNKENYFTPEWYEKYPLAAPHFCKWIDQYKNLVGWDELFLDLEDRPAPKFHEVPLELQIGILSRYFYETYKWEIGSSWIGGCPFIRPKLIAELDYYFENTNKFLINNLVQ